MSITHRFANLSVNKKLALGFALVLLMTFFVTLAGIQSLGRMSVHNEKMGAITELYELVHQARFLRLQFEISRSAADAQALEQHIDRIEQYIGELKLQFNKPQNLALMGQELVALSDYRGAFRRLQQEPEGRQQVMQGCVS
jgi:methyl-accepting chemotaxis protein